MPEEATVSVSLVTGSFSHPTSPVWVCFIGGWALSSAAELGGDDQDSFVKQALSRLG